MHRRVVPLQQPCACSGRCFHARADGALAGDGGLVVVVVVVMEIVMMVVMVMVVFMMKTTMCGTLPPCTHP